MNRLSRCKYYKARRAAGVKANCIEVSNFFKLALRSECVPLRFPFWFSDLELQPPIENDPQNDPK